MSKTTPLLDHLLFIDIETVPQYSDFNLVPELWQQLFLEKIAKTVPEDYSAEKLYLEKAGILAEFGKIICISLGYLFKDEQKNILFKTKTIAHDDEHVILNEFVHTVNKFYGKYKGFFFAGHNIREFDIPYICRRMIVNNMALPAFLPHGSEKPWEVNLLDTLQYWKFGDYKNYISLNLLANVLGIPSSKDDISGKDVCRVYYQEKDLLRIAKYCAKDIVVVANICLKLQQLPSLTEAQIAWE